MLAYVFWHRPAAGVERERYEHELERLHRSLAHRPPSGLRSSATLRVAELPWDDGEPPQPAYEDWYVVDDWTALGVLEEAAVSRGHLSSHEAVAKHSQLKPAAVYRLLEGAGNVADAASATWISAPALPGHERPSLDALLGDGIDPRRDGLWRRCLVLGPSPEYCLLAAEAPAGVAATRLPAGWRARTLGREPVWDG